MRATSSWPSPADDDSFVRPCCSRRSVPLPSACRCSPRDSSAGRKSLNRMASLRSKHPVILSVVLPWLLLASSRVTCFILIPSATPPSGIPAMQRARVRALRSPTLEAMPAAQLAARSRWALPRRQRTGTAALERRATKDDTTGPGVSATAPSRANTRSDNTAAASTRSRPSLASSPGGTRGLESPFGLRRRVKAVLQKAKNRTGIRNYNTEFAASSSSTAAASTVAEAASIGGFESNAADLEYRFQPSSLPSLSAWSALNSTSNGALVLQLSLPSSSEPSAGTPGRIEHNTDALLSGNVSDPLPFELPTLTVEQERQLQSGERVQEQSKMGREGSGFVVMDIDAPPYVVWECLLDFEAYPDNIGTVKSMVMFTNTHLKSSYMAERPVLPGTGREARHYGKASVTRASFVLSKFHLKIAAIHKYRPHPDGHYMVFTLDPACKNLVMKDAKGIWYTQGLQGGNRTRVWLLCEVKVAPILPSFIVDYAAKRAMPRATTWLPPLAERRARQWLLGPANGAEVKTFMGSSGSSIRST